MKPVVILGLLVACVIGTTVWASETISVLDFALEDQFGTTHTDEDCGEAVTVLLGGDRKGSAYIDDWGPALHRALATELDEGTVCSVGFANLKGVPFFVRKKIIRSFPADPESWTILDWKGEIARKWGFEKNAANLYVFDREGRIVFHIGLRGFDQVQFDQSVEAVKMLMVDE